MASDPFGTSGTPSTGGSGTQVGSATTPIPTSDMQLGEVRTQAPTPTQGQEMSSHGQDVPQSQQEVLKRKPSRPPSNAWAHFKKLNDKATCNYCNKQYACNSASHGTSNMLKYLKVCVKNSHRVIDKRQKTIAIGKQCDDDPDSVSMKLVEFNQEVTRYALARMLVVNELPFKFVENQGFRDLMSEAQPRFKIPSRVTIAKDCMQLFQMEKARLKCILSGNHQMVSLTTDTWTSIQNLNYMCVTAHYIDDGWELNKKILSFGLIADHKGETIGNALEKCMKEWGISKICCVTVDNASANNTAIVYLLRRMNDWSGTSLLNGEFMHMRCCAHILNLIVSDGLKEIDVSIERIRAAYKFVRSSPARLSTFKTCVQEASITSKAMLTLDVPTRQNSTYFMLDVAEKYENAFYRLEDADNAFLLALDNVGGPPSREDWSRARVFVKLLKIFYDATLFFSGSLHVTSNVFFHKLCDIQKTLGKWKKNNDVGLQRMATNMKIKFDKYWESSGSINFLLFVAVFLDPRYKFEYVKFSFDKMYGDGSNKCKEMVERLKGLIDKLFEYYQSIHPIPLDIGDSSRLVSNVASQSHASNDDLGDDNEGWEDEFRSKVRRKQGEVKRNELERYKEDDVEDNTPGFDILKWWKGKSMKYYVLSRMARDILAIPVSTVSSESAFSTGGRVLDPFRSSLHPTTVEALICIQNWIKTPKKNLELRDEIEEVKKVESELSGLSSNLEVGLQ